jgi:hypothetical protein
MDLLANNRGVVLTLALNYGGRQEIVDAVNAALKAGEPISEETIARHLQTAPLPDPDLMIRTSGEYRLSNFLLWQAAYTEIHVTPTYWPDFRREQFLAALVGLSTAGTPVRGSVMVLPRILTALVLAPVFLWVLYLGNVPFLAFMFILIVIGSLGISPDRRGGGLRHPRRERDTGGAGWRCRWFFRGSARGSFSHASAGLGGDVGAPSFGFPRDGSERQRGFHVAVGHVAHRDSLDRLAFKLPSLCCASFADLPERP